MVYNIKIFNKKPQYIFVSVPIACYVCIFIPEYSVVKIIDIVAAFTHNRIVDVEKTAFIEHRSLDDRRGTVTYSVKNDVSQILSLNDIIMHTIIIWFSVDITEYNLL
uniref:Cation transporter n=1 Tax=Heterorhabditis bacteriophora TaxID=37862 RepID=A0A1I7WJZ0_HETBA